MDKKPQQKDNSRFILAVVLIGLGIILLLKQIGLHLEWPMFYIHEVFLPFRKVFHGLGNFLFSWQMVFIVVGLILLAGKRSAGIVLIIIGSVFILPKIFFVSGLTFSFFIPVLLVAIGVAMVLRRI